MKFKKEWLLDTLGDENDVENEISHKSRWSIFHRRVFKYDNKFYVSCYSVGATEQQDESPYEYDPDEIECEEVRPVEKMTIVYE